jgi:hypothetical protein
VWLCSVPEMLHTGPNVKYCEQPSCFWDVGAVTGKALEGQLAAVACV